jgi:hypothetical protein
VLPAWEIRRQLIVSLLAAAVVSGVLCGRARSDRGRQPQPGPARGRTRAPSRLCRSGGGHARCRCAGAVGQGAGYLLFGPAGPRPRGPGLGRAPCGDRCARPGGARLRRLRARPRVRPGPALGRVPPNRNVDQFAFDVDVEGWTETGLVLLLAKQVREADLSRRSIPMPSDWP